jgi:hypothetical protein
MARGAVVATLAASGAGLTSATAQAACSRGYTTYLQDQYSHYRFEADWDFANYSYAASHGDPGGADFWFGEWVMDLSTVQYYSSRLNMCQVREP